MFFRASITSIIRAGPEIFQRDSLVWFYGIVRNGPLIPLLFKSSSFAMPLHYQQSCRALSACSGFLLESHGDIRKWLHVRYMRNASVELKADGDTVRFSHNNQHDRNGSLMEEKKGTKKVKISKKARRNELRFYRLKAKKKMNSSNPEVRITYKLEKAKRKEAWLIEKLRKFELPKAPAEAYDPESLTEEERHYLKRTGEKKKNYVLVGRRGVFGGVVLNMHLHWKKHETVKIVYKPCKPGKIHEYAEELTRLSKGIVIDIKPSNTILFYRGKNYVQPEVISPPDSLSKDKALEKYRYEQSLEHTSWFIEKLEKELEEYYEHVAWHKKGKEDAQRDSLATDRGEKTENMVVVLNFAPSIRVEHVV